MAVINAVGNALTSSTGSGAFVGATSPTITTPVMATSLTFSPTTGGIVGTTTNDDTAAGNVGAFLTSAITSPASISTNTATNLTSISLSAGDWDVWANITYISASTTVLNQILTWISTSSASVPANNSTISRISYGSSGISDVGVGVVSGIVAPSQRFSVAGATPVYISGFATFITSTLDMVGAIYARRRR